jgi:hypothetical protein
MIGAERIKQERIRQIHVEGCTPQHDEQWTSEQLAEAAAFYAIPEKYGELLAFWPWNPKRNKKSKHSRIRQLEIAGALVAAEIDRLQRLENGRSEEAS